MVLDTQRVEVGHGARAEVLDGERLREAVRVGVEPLENGAGRGGVDEGALGNAVSFDGRLFASGISGGEPYSAPTTTTNPQNGMQEITYHHRVPRITLRIAAQQRHTLLLEDNDVLAVLEDVGVFDLLLLEDGHILERVDVGGDELQRARTPGQLRPEEGNAAAEGLLFVSRSAHVAPKDCRPRRWRDHSGEIDVGRHCGDGPNEAEVPRTTAGRILPSIFLITYRSFLEPMAGDADGETLEEKESGTQRGLSDSEGHVLSTFRWSKVP